LLTHAVAMQIYFRKLGGASVDGPDLGPVTKLGMGRKTGKPVHVPKAAAALPDMGGSDALAAEFGAPVASVAMPDSNGVTAAQTGGAGSGAAAAASPLAKQSDQQADAADDGGIVGGLVVAEADMQGVAEQELAYLQKRCKRKRATQPSAAGV
jgi:hypothetical protein